MVKPDQTVDLRPVTSGVHLNGETAVSGDLKAGEIVVTDGQLNLVAGKKVSLKATGGGGEVKAGMP